ncbi:MAG: hypothetical protein A2782_02485 [Candidatus Blackburnbacteria bacterium RIFCSPHIGHO2_01_FULL_43_15b]|uniref:Uncharacterized protein n=1 Tax=Candidatus Blackburnbacteria bacterium RIFCSPHIGHO2_01_FULL_43_15b TaxID=1797513 RepID=A0A1G1V2P5_9BACT|nr:MAG: hypothetical protein A2782_02485 [Candidatus Blackburnbacteria bacterium RIFCSPHIGHO2_01_FULL_43_15b]
MKSKILFKLTSIFLCFQIVFTTLAPALVYAQDGILEPFPEQPAETVPQETLVEAPAPSDSGPAVEEQATEAPPAEVQEPEVPQEPSPVEEAPVPVQEFEPQPQEAPVSTEFTEQIASEQAEMSGSLTELQTAREDEGSVSITSANEQAQDVTEDYRQTALEFPVVDASSQQDLLNEYENYGDEVTGRTDAPTQDAREITSDQTVLQNLISGIEEAGNQLPGALSDTFSSSQDAIVKTPEILSGILNAGYEEQLGNLAEAAEQEVIKAQADQQAQIDAALNAPTVEQIQAAKQALGLDDETPDDQVIPAINKALEGTGFTLEGDIDNPAITGISIYDPQNPDFQNFTPGQWQERLQQGQTALKSIGEFSLNMASGGGLDLGKAEIARNEANKSDLDQLENLRQGTGFSPPFGVIDPEQEREIIKLQRLSSDDLKAEIDRIRTEQPDDVSFFEQQLTAKKAYADRLAQYDKEQMQRIDDGMKDYAAFVILNTVGAKAMEKGGDFLAPYAERVTSPIRNAAKTVVDFVGGFFKKEALNVEERAVQTALQKGEPVFAQTLISAGDYVQTIGTRQNEGFPPLTPFDDQPAFIRFKVMEVWTKTFGNLTNDFSQESEKAQMQVFAEWLRAGKTEEEIVSKYYQAAKAMIDANGGQLESSINAAARYNSRLTYDTGVANQLLDLTDSLLLKSQGEKVLASKLDDAASSLAALRKYAVDNGADKQAFSAILRATDPDNIHIVTPAKLQALGQPANTAGLYVGSDKQLLIRADTDMSAVVTHECVHAACGLTTKDVVQKAEALNYQLGGVKNRKKLTEGLTEWANLKAYELQGKQPDFVSGYGQQVNAVEKIIQKLQEGGYVLDKGLERPEAEAKVIEAAVSGYYGRLYEPLGKGNEQKGQQILKEILDNTPDTSSNVIEAHLPTNVPEKVQILTPKERAAIVAAGLAVSAPLEYIGIKGIIEIREEENKLLPFNFPFVKHVNAQVSDKGEPKHYQIFNMKTRLNFIKHTLSNDGFVSKDLVEEILKSDIVDPSVIQTPSGYVFVTGKTGSVSGKIESGNYTIRVPSYEQISLVFPQKVEIRNREQVVPIGINYDKGANNQARNKTSFLKIAAYATENDQPIKVTTYYDQNRNGKWDDNEHAIPWAGVQVELRKVNQEKFINLSAGWNLITLTAVPSIPLTASSLLAQIAKQGGYATSVANLENGEWQTYVQRGDKAYSGQDFPLLPGKAYFVKNLKKSVMIFEGQDFAAPLKTTLASGWNAVGFPKNSTFHKVSDLISGDLTMARWKSGLWDTYVKQSKEQYGEDFPIEVNRGYIIKVKDKSELAI